jgi:hypothetical protein
VNGPEGVGGARGSVSSERARGGGGSRARSESAEEFAEVVRAGERGRGWGTERRGDGGRGLGEERASASDPVHGVVAHRRVGVASRRGTCDHAPDMITRRTSRARSHAPTLLSARPDSRQSVPARATCPPPEDSRKPSRLLDAREDGRDGDRVKAEVEEAAEHGERSERRSDGVERAGGVAGGGVAFRWRGRRREDDEAKPRRDEIAAMSSAKDGRTDPQARRAGTPRRSLISVCPTPVAEGSDGERAASCAACGLPSSGAATPPPCFVRVRSRHPLRHINLQPPTHPSQVPILP